MDRFDDPRDKRKKADRYDPRDTRSLTQSPDPAAGKDDRPAAKSVQELIEEEMRLESGYKQENKELTENGKISETMTFLSMAQREELFAKKCAVLGKYKKAFHDEYERYRRSLFKLRSEREDYGKLMYSKGVSQGRSDGEMSKEAEMMPELDKAREKTKKLKFYLWLMVVLEILTAGLLIGIII